MFGWGVELMAGYSGSVCPIPPLTDPAGNEGGGVICDPLCLQ